MAQPLNVGMPDGQDIGPNYAIRITAIDPTTGNLVTGVKIDTVVLDVTLVAGTAADLQTGQWFLVPGPNA